MAVSTGRVFSSTSPLGLRVRHVVRIPIVIGHNWYLFDWRIHIRSPFYEPLTWASFGWQFLPDSDPLLSSVR